MKIEKLTDAGTEQLLNDIMEADAIDTGRIKVQSILKVCLARTLRGHHISPAWVKLFQFIVTDDLLHATAFLGDTESFGFVRIEFKYDKDNGVWRVNYCSMEDDHIAVSLNNLLTHYMGEWLDKAKACDTGAKGGE